MTTVAPSSSGNRHVLAKLPEHHVRHPADGRVSSDGERGSDDRTSCVGARTLSDSSRQKSNFSHLPQEKEKPSDHRITRTEGGEIVEEEDSESETDGSPILSRSPAPTPARSTTFSVSNITDKATVTVSNGKILATMNNKTYEITVENIEAGTPSDITSAIASNNKQHEQMLKLAEKVCEYLSKSGFLDNGNATITLDNTSNTISQVTQGSKTYQRTDHPVTVHATELNTYYTRETTHIQTQRSALNRKIALKNEFIAKTPNSKSTALLIDVPGKGNCGPLALYDQLTQIDRTKYGYLSGEASGQENPKAQQFVRDTCANYLYNLSWKPKDPHFDELVKQTYISLNSDLKNIKLNNPYFQFPTLETVMGNGNFVSISGEKIREILDKDIDSLNIADKRILLRYRALYFTQQDERQLRDVSHDFWQTYVNANPNYNIAIISKNSGFPSISQLYISEKNTNTTPNKNNTLFLYYNSGHFRSLNRNNDQFINNLLNDLDHRNDSNSLFITPKPKKIDIEYIPTKFTSPVKAKYPSPVTSTSTTTSTTPPATTPTTAPTPKKTPTPRSLTPTRTTKTTKHHRRKLASPPPTSTTPAPKPRKRTESDDLLSHFPMGKSGRPVVIGKNGKQTQIVDLGA